VNTLEIEWKHLDIDGKTCVRCSDTGEAIQEVVERLSEECKPFGWTIEFKETKLTEEGIQESNAILFNGKPLEAILPGAKTSSSYCSSCSKLLGKPTNSCRTLEYDGSTYEGIPSSLIRQAACKMTQCC